MMKPAQGEHPGTRGSAVSPGLFARIGGIDMHYASLVVKEGRRTQTAAIWMCLLTVVFFAGNVFAQEFRGSITGLVTDPSGAVVAGGRVTVTNVATNVTTWTLSNATGNYAVRITLLLYVPFRQTKAMRIEQPVSQIDLVPTLLQLMGHKAPESLQGESLLPLLEGKKRREDHVFIEWHTVPDGPHARTVVTPDGWKMALFDRDNCLLFNREKDPLEMRNLYYRKESAPVIRRLRAKIEAWQKKTNDKLQLASS